MKKGEGSLAFPVPFRVSVVNADRVAAAFRKTTKRMQRQEKEKK